MSSEVPSSLEQTYPFVKVIIPAYNAESRIGDLIRRIKALNQRIEVVVVDDGSADSTSEVAANAGARIIRHEKNKGKGQALRTGFKYALRTGAKAVITLDADGQHLPEEIPGLIERWIETNAAIVIGTRKREPGNMPVVRIISNALSSWLVSLAAGTRIDDSQSGYRLLTVRVLRAFRTTSGGYDAETEILIKASMRGFRIESAPISTVYSTEKSYIHPLKQPLLFIGLIFRSVYWRLGYLVRKRSKTDPSSSDK